MKTLKDAQRFYANAPSKIHIERSVRYYAVVGNTRYSLLHDWTLEMLERNLWTRIK